MDSGGCLISVLFSWLDVGFPAAVNLIYGRRGEAKGMEWGFVGPTPRYREARMSGWMDEGMGGGMDGTAVTVRKIPWP